MTIKEALEVGLIVEIKRPKLPKLPVARVVGLSIGWRHFWRGVIYGAAFSIMHHLMHVLGIW